jgi:hypothetical protein
VRGRSVVILEKYRAALRGSELLLSCLTRKVSVNGTQEYRVAIVPFGEAHRVSTSELATHVFVTREPMTARLGATHDEIRPFMAELCAISIREQAGVVAIDSATQQIIGFAIGKDFTTQLEFEPSPTVAPIFDLLNRVDATARLDAAIEFGDLWHVLIAGTSYPRSSGGFPRAAGGRGLGLEMAEVAMTNMLARGYRRAYCECTNARSARIARALGGRLVSEILYADYVFPETGERCFADLSERSCAAYLRELVDGT